MGHHLSPGPTKHSPDLLIDVVEIPDQFGSQYIVDNRQYVDLDDLLVNHVKAMSRKVDELVDHEKFKEGSEDAVCKSMSLAILLITVLNAPFYSGLTHQFCSDEPHPKFVRIWSRSEQAWSLQSLILAQPSITCPNLGESA